MAGILVKEQALNLEKARLREQYERRETLLSALSSLEEKIRKRQDKINKLAGEIRTMGGNAEAA